MRIAIVGAGAGGLSAARRLREQGFDPVIFEAGSHVGGLWVYENDNGFAQAYKALHINSATEITAYDGFPFPEGTPTYPRHDQMATYFVRFAERFDLMRSIRFKTPVTGLTRMGNTWTVHTDSGDHEFDHVVIASGHQSLPNMPELPGTFDGKVLHSREYRTSDPYHDKRVLVLGVGNSGLDIAADICTVAEHTVISARSPVLILPRMVFGKPASRVLGAFEKPWIPSFVKQKLREFLAVAAHGRMEQWGFETAKTRTHPTSHPTAMHHMIWHRIVGKPGVKSIEGRTVTFANGTADDFDYIIAATGYRTEIPFLSKDLQPSDGRNINLYRRIILPGTENLYFHGMFNVSGGANVPMLDEQARWIAASIAGKISQPSSEQMKQSIREEQERMAKRYPDSYRYGLELDPGRYLKQIRREYAR